ncbi:MAG: hypothetical protein R3F21_25070 [Myxococcota bacterium]
MKRLGLYRVLMGTLGVAWAVFGFGLVAAFFLYQRPGSQPLVPTGPVGHYFVAFSGCALIGWGSAMIGAAREPWSSTSRTVGTATAFVLVLMAVVRMVAWAIGDYATWLGEVPRQEAAALLIVALALVWLRPTVADTIAWGATNRRRRSDRAPTPAASTPESPNTPDIPAGPVEAAR